MSEERSQRKGKKTPLQEWYDTIMERETPYCWETDIYINKLDTDWWHGSIAHVLPKKLFKSVATHPMNFLVLNMWDAHKKYDKDWYSASKMKVWPEAVKRFIIMYPNIHPFERKYIPAILLKELPDHLKSHS
jgi:hypothetical protein